MLRIAEVRHWPQPGDVAYLWSSSPGMGADCRLLQRLQIAFRAGELLVHDIINWKFRLT
jgi:hypothetical protein